MTSLATNAVKVGCNRSQEINEIKSKNGEAELNSIFTDPKSEKCL